MFKKIIKKLINSLLKKKIDENLDFDAKENNKKIYDFFNKIKIKTIYEYDLFKIFYTFYNEKYNH